MDAGRPLYFLLVLLWIGVTGLNANVGTLILLIKAAFPFMRIICPTDFVCVTNRIKLFLTFVSLCVDFCTDYLLTGPARLTRGLLRSQSFRKPMSENLACSVRFRENYSLNSRQGVHF